MQFSRAAATFLSALFPFMQACTTGMNQTQQEAARKSLADDPVLTTVGEHPVLHCKTLISKATGQPVEGTGCIEFPGQGMK
jgi:hypothetical protein